MVKCAWGFQHSAAEYLKPVHIRNLFLPFKIYKTLFTTHGNKKTPPSQHNHQLCATRVCFNATFHSPLYVEYVRLTSTGSRHGLPCQVMQIMVEVTAAATLCVKGASTEHCASGGMAARATTAASPRVRCPPCFSYGCRTTYGGCRTTAAVLRLPYDITKK